MQARDRARRVSPGTQIGHVHLKVSNIERALRFYRDILGFEGTQWYGEDAVFLSAGGYHHHIGLNTWMSRNAPPAPRNPAGPFHPAPLHPRPRLPPHDPPAPAAPPSRPAPPPPPRGTRPASSTSPSSTPGGATWPRRSAGCWTPSTPWRGPPTTASPRPST